MLMYAQGLLPLPCPQMEWSTSEFFLDSRKKSGGKKKMMPSSVVMIYSMALPGSLTKAHPGYFIWISGPSLS